MTGPGSCCTNIRIDGGGIQGTQRWQLGPARRFQSGILGTYSYYRKWNNANVYSDDNLSLFKESAVADNTNETYWKVYKIMQKVVNNL